MCCATTGLMGDTELSSKEYKGVGQAGLAVGSVEADETKDRDKEKSLLQHTLCSCEAAHVDRQVP